MAHPINLNRFDLVSLRLFVATVEGGSLTAGAGRFGISLAAASKRIAELEAHVGTTLLVRGKRGVAPTAAGRALLRHAIELTAGVEQLALTMDDFRRGAGGHLRLWANTSAFVSFLPRVLATYSATHPAVMLDLEDALSEDAAQAVVTGAAELAVIGANTPAERLQTFVCDVDELVLLVPASHELARAGSVAMREVLALDIVGLARATSLMRQVAAAAATAGRALKIRVQVRSFDAMCRMVAAGLGVAILPRAGAEPHLRSMGLRALHLQGMPTERRLLLAMRDRALLSAPARGFVDLALESLSPAASG